MHGTTLKTTNTAQIVLVHIVITRIIFIIIKFIIIIIIIICMLNYTARGLGWGGGMGKG